MIRRGAGYSPSVGSNVTLSTIRKRFHDSSPITTGDLGTRTSGSPARVSYNASYYDAANRLTASVNVGTNGGAAYTRSAQGRHDCLIPLASMTSLRHPPPLHLVFPAVCRLWCRPISPDSGRLTARLRICHQ